MAQYQQDPALINPPRYTGQAAGSGPQGADGRGPLQESRYGATPVSTGYGNNQNNGLGIDGGQSQQQSTSPIDTIRDPAAYGFQNQRQSQPETGFKFPGTSGGNPQQGLGQGTPQMADPNTSPSQAGYGNSQRGYGQSGMHDGTFDQPSRMQGTQMAGSNVDPSQTGYGDQPSRMQGTQMAGSNVDPSQTGYGDQPSRMQGTQTAGSNVDPSQTGYGDQPSRMQGTQMAGSNVDPSQTGYGDQPSRMQGSQMAGSNVDPSQTGYGNQPSRMQGAQMAGSNVDPSQTGYGDQPSRMQGTQMAGSNVDRSQTGYGDQPSRMQGTQMAGSNVDRSQTGYGDSQLGYGQTGARDKTFQQQPVEQGLGNHMPSQAGSYGSTQNVYGQNVTPAAGDLAFSQQQPGHGQPGFGAPTQGMNTTNLWPTPATPPGAHRTDNMVGDGGNQSQQQPSQGYGASNLNMGANRNSEQYGTDGAPWQAGGTDRQSLGSELPGSHPHHRSAAGVDTTQGVLGTTNMNHPSMDTGFGGGVGSTPSAVNSIPPGEHRVEPGYDGSAGNLQNLSSGGHPRRETLGEKIEEDRLGGEHHNRHAQDRLGGAGDADPFPQDHTAAATTARVDDYEDTDNYSHAGGAPPKKGLMAKIKEKLTQ